ncbi:tRNA (adenosine(37)-N6)-threonylcarbamoyltransferase complex ATPase subunit type 1 TsaE [Mycoplasmatota bacterium WC44]
MKMLSTSNVEETIELGIKLGRMLFPGAIVTLNGDLGAGKTTFTKGIAKGLDIERVVSSPTFTIMKVYEGRLNLYHMDVYRLEGIGYDYDLEEYLYGDGVSVVEWSENIKNSLEGYLRIDITIKDGNRKFVIDSDDARYNEILEKL